MTELLTFIFGLFGGLAINLISLTELKNVPSHDRPKTFSDPIYVVWFFAIPIMGGVLTWAYKISGSNVNPILAINIGASAPLILKSFASAIPQIGGRKIN